MTTLYAVEARLDGTVMAGGVAETLIDAHIEALKICRTLFAPATVSRLLFVPVEAHEITA